MKVPLSWLKEFVDIPISAEELAHRITMAGLEVSEIQYIGHEGAELVWDPDKIRIANILEVRPHPNADMLVLADVEYGAPQPHVVVTGAPNLFPYKGQGPLSHPLKAVLAHEGAKLYDGHKPGNVLTTLKGRPVRGIMSDAMLCSEKELGISDEHEGIIFLEDDAPIGMPLRDFMGDIVFHIDVTPDKAHCLSIVGVAREVAAITGSKLHLPDPQVVMEGPPIAGRANVTIEEPDLCPRFTVGLIEGITICPSPPWMQRRLTNAGMRPINNIVDISNYVMLEWGEPTHAFDADKVHEHHLIARLARPGETLVTLDGKKHDLTAQHPTDQPPLLVCDPNGPLAIAGVMGGEESEVRETTTNILLEAAIWQPQQIRRTARIFKIPSEASRRFERGVDYEIPLVAQRRALELIRTYAGGTVAQDFLDEYPRPWQTCTLELPPSEITRIIGIQLTAYDTADVLRPLGFQCDVCHTTGMGDLAGYAVGMGLDPAVVKVHVPSSRQDITMLADLCEEVARIYGYDKIPFTRMSDKLPKADTHPELDLERRVRTTMVGCGLHDVITYSLTSMESVARLNPSQAVASKYLRVSNAISPEREYLQQSLLPTLLEALATNLRERSRAMICEVGNVFLPSEYYLAYAKDVSASTSATGEQPETDNTNQHEKWLPDELRHLAIAIAGPRMRPTWKGLQGDESGSSAVLDFFDMKGIIETLLSQLGLAAQASFMPLTDDERFHPGRAATLILEQPADTTDAVSKPSSKKKHGKAEIISTRVGVLGEIHPDACERLEIETPRVVAAEINLDALFACIQPSSFKSISRYPASVQDIAVVADTHVPAEKIAATIQRGAGDVLESLSLFDVYSGPQIGQGKRSLAYRLTFRASDRTLNDEAVAKLRNKIVKLLEREMNATIRG